MTDPEGLKDNDTGSAAESTPRPTPGPAASKSASDAGGRHQDGGRGANESRNEDQNKSGGKGAVVVAIIAIIIALGAGGGAWWVWQDTQTKLALQDKKVEKTESLVSTSQNQLQTTVGSLNSSRDQLTSLTGSVAGLQEAIKKQDELASAVSGLKSETGLAQERVDSIAGSIQGIRGLVQGGKDAWLQSEAEYLLALANQRLQLSGDVPTALAALQAADGRLKALQDPSLFKVRKLLHEEMTSLKSVDLPDLEGAALELGSVATRISDLPIKQNLPPKHFKKPAQDGVPAEQKPGATASTETPAAASSRDWGSLDTYTDAAGELAGGLKELVVIRYDGKPIEPMLPPDADYFLRQNLQLKLESARIALLNGEEAIFRDVLRDSRAWIERYFDLEAAATKNALQLIGSLQVRKMTFSKPDISKSLRMLRQITLEQAAPTAGEGA